MPLMPRYAITDIHFFTIQVRIHAAGALRFFGRRYQRSSASGVTLTRGAMLARARAAS